MAARPLRLCAVSFKLCWRDEQGRWMSSGGFPLQMSAIGSLFDAMDLLIVETTPQAGGLPLPAFARVVPLRAPRGHDLRRKLSVVAHLWGHVRTIGRHIRSADVVHVPLPGDLPLIALVVALASRTRVIARYGGSWRRNTESTFATRVTKTLMRRAAGGRNVMLATGDESAPPAPRMSWVFSTAISAAELAQVPNAPERGLSTPPRLVYVGRLSSEKGVTTLLEALALLREREPAVRPCLTLIGDGPERVALEAQAHTLGIEEQVRFAGQLTRDALNRELASMDLCVQPSYTEGFSKAWLDAMAHGIPVIASEVGAAGSVVGRGEERGWIVPPRDAGALAARLEHVLRADIDWPALRRRCRCYVESRTLEAWSRRIGELCARQWGWHLEGGRLSR